MRYLCIHSHFYQPPRENPWLEAIELQDSAYPYHDWNERIDAECYARNSAARILDPEQRITQIVNNYAKISFNFGPTILSWTEDKAPATYQAILDADRESRKLRSGHGNALGQAYNHMILPLANRCDKRTQVLWGVEDFAARFGRRPEGMWLPETAADMETLEVLAEHGLRFTILAPHQARRVRPIGGREWQDVSGARIDPTRAYRINLPSGRSLALFFYDGPVSRAVAFERLLDSGEFFAQRLMGISNQARTWPELLHIATDGESYGHHHRHGEMALAYAVHHIEKNRLAEITNYGEYLDRCPPAHEVEIYERTSWSCGHGIDRWARNCGCNSGCHGGWTQEWRQPLRAALDWLRDEVGPRYERAMRELVADPWRARDDYIHVLLDRSSENRKAFVARHATRPLLPPEEVTLWKLLELQRHAMLMYTSCGWFFDEISGIETVQVIQYAGRVVQIAEELFRDSTERRFLDLLAKAKSNLQEHGDATRIYERFVRPTVVDLDKVAAHYGISSMFEPYPEDTQIFCYSATRDSFRAMEAGRMRLALGRARFTSDITQDTDVLTFGVLHFGDHNIIGGVRRFTAADGYDSLVRTAADAFARADIPEVIRLLDRGFGGHVYSLKSLFRDQQRKILSLILNSTVDEAEASYRQLYEHHAPLMRFLTSLGTPLPKAFRATAEYALNSLLRREFGAEDLDLERIRALLDEVNIENVALDSTTLEYTVRRTVERLSSQLAANPRDLDLVERLEATVRLLRSLPFPVVLWVVENQTYAILKSLYPEVERAGAQGDESAAAWMSAFRKLCEALRLRVP